MGSILPVLFMFVVTAALITASALFVPKGPNQITIRTGLMIALTACYLTWMVTYIAQLHPLLSPVRTPGLKA